MASRPRPDLSLFVDILHTLEEIGAPYVIIGAFAGIVYGINRTTYERVDRPRGEFFHTNWTGTGGAVTASTYQA